MRMGNIVRVTVRVRVREEEMFCLVSQMRRVAYLICSNLIEGSLEIIQMMLPS